ncbi:outer membrane protein assembly factor BamC [Uliginosibacterium paludis]|uniref:Outer membrane protein assembly factor BamC n=1 Tax=Uliginosibacterium paludis TaxID=1615952 RepID=A0ABV2CVT3_9RHOO
MRSKIGVVLATSLLGLTLAACGGNKNEKVDYKSPGIDLRGKGNALEVPPDLVSPARDNRYALPEAGDAGSATYSTYNASRQPAAAAANAAPAAAAPAGSAKFRIEREGNTRWIVTTLPANVVWPQLQDFWKNLGFVLVKDDQAVGIMETDWLENRAKIAGDPVQRVLSTVLGSMVSNGERDRYRTRIEPSAAKPGMLEIYVSHRGAIEISKRDTDGTYWELRPSNPDLEAEMLQRILVRLGQDADGAKQMVADSKAAPQPERAAIVAGPDGVQQLQVKDGMERAWRQIGLALDRVGVVVEDRDRAKGVYFVRYVGESDLEGPKKDQNWFSRLFSSKKADTGTNQYQVAVSGNDRETTVRLLDKDGNRAVPEANRQIMNLLLRELK